ncbi:hypothetical protein [Alloactinosynnema sp. L-07]|uniref:hypothetical protein n=1 Tax=Alloactinosynnema sp. L-07 TaxID=1653480 RepID=UPI00065EF684|nr:hypothetical protein [Alloactinosynnema sp. L-07]CRK58765.1 hypothetical protein [Alloactinosynnema sp. L-07]
MTGTEINGKTAAMAAFGAHLTAPTIPPSLARLGMPPNLAGLFEGIAMSIVDKAATAEVAAYLTKVTEEMVTYSTKVTTTAAAYTAADVASAAELVSATLGFAQQAVSLAQQAQGLLATENPTEESAAADRAV